jgi:hypothetical protein
MEMIDRYEKKRGQKNILHKMKGHLLKMSRIAEIVKIGDEVVRKGKRRQYK